ncbi:MAG TPA: type VI secretion system baseplate subunit TssG [Blastocatellia bacterium]|nr:type VI secretion system baseplate subunit TssG [Blastocatellia bacterium]
MIKLFFDEAYGFDFFQAVRILERIYPERAPVGRDGDPSREVVRFRTRVSLDFPASQIYAIRPDADPDGPAQMMVAFMGLTGPLGVLPHPYTELLMERTRYQDTGLWEFLDIFNHRLISLFYRAWEKYRFSVAYERGEEDRLTEYLFDVIGMGTRGLRGRADLPDEGLLFYGGLIAQRPHSATATEAILGDYFNVGARVEQFAGQWLRLDDESLTRVGVANSHLGLNTVAGARVWDDQSKFRLKFGPLAFKEFSNFLPVGSAFKPAAELIRLLAGMEFDFDIQLILKAEEVPGCVLTTQAKRRPMLGWTTWLKTGEFAEDDSQVILNAGGAVFAVN